jgi:hypothetical protein
MDSATDLSTRRMPLLLVRARRGRMARRIRRERTALSPPAELSAISISVVTTMKKSSWFVRACWEGRV